MITEFNRENYVKNLPDAFRKAEDSNNRKILEIEKSASDALRMALSAIFDSLDIEKATGKTLELYGAMIGQERGEATDEQYRVMMKARISRNLADADHSSVINAICATFGCDPSEVLLVETETPCTVRVENLPFEKLNSSNIDVETAIQIIKGLMPAGVLVESLNFSGTFEFGGTELEYDEEKGFGNVDQTIGGYLGLLSVSKTGSLPV